MMPYILNIFFYYPSLLVMLLFFGLGIGLSVMWNDIAGMVLCGIIIAFLLPWTIRIFILNYRLRKTEEPLRWKGWT